VLPVNWQSSLVVATDGRVQTDSAIAAAKQLVGSGPLRVISVLSIGNSTERDPFDAIASRTIERQRDAVMAQLSRVIGGMRNVSLELRTGYPPAVLASFGQVHEISLLVVGIGRTPVLERLSGDESTLRLARMTRTPLLAVAARCAVPPTRIVVATDLSPTSVRAGQLAMALSPDADVSLVHVNSPSAPRIPEASFARVADALQTGYCGRVRVVELTGDPATEVLSYANAIHADMITVGALGERKLPHGAIGAVATRVIRCASCSVLLAPDDD
jgi:nucleotide-binding universal stress UspA family protein